MTAAHPSAAGVSHTTAGTAVTTATASANRGALGIAGRRVADLRAREFAARQRTGSITGTVLGAGGTPLAGACVTAIGPTRSVTTGSGPDGRFDITGLAAGGYVLEYRDCAAPGRYLTRWSGGTAWQRTAAQVRVRVAEASRVPAMMLTPVRGGVVVNSAAATWQRMLAHANRVLTATAAAKTGKITGVVTGKGRPLRGICVEVFPVTSGFGYAGSTGKTGKYTIGEIAPGRYYVAFEPSFSCLNRANWLAQTYRGHNSPIPFGGNEVKVVSGKTTQRINASLIQGGQITGIVTTRSGKPLHGICVNANFSVPGSFIALQMPNNTDGTYALHGLFPGTYSLEFTTGCPFNGNYAPAIPPAVTIKGTDHRRVSVALGIGAILTGTVRFGSSSGPALSGICVQASNSSGSISASGSTGANGSYSLNSLGTGVYGVSFAPGCNNIGNYVPTTKYVHAAEGKVTSLDAVLQQGAEITGKVTSTSGAGLGGICIELAGTGSANLPEGTNPDGSYLINQMSAGTYELGFVVGCGNSGNYAPYFYDDQFDPSLATPFTVAAASTQTINAQMQVGGEISGTVRSAAGRKLTGVCVGAATANQAEVGVIFTQIVFSQDGRFQFTGLEPGQYYVSFGCGAAFGSDAGQWFPAAPTASTADIVSVAAGQTSGIGAVLQPGGTITGVVTGRSGKPLADICVQLVTKTGISVGPGAFGPGTNSRGVYEISGVPAGRYDVEFSPCLAGSRYTTQWYPGKAVQSAAAPVKIRARATTAGINARLTIGGTISGRVAGADGKPLDNVCVVAYNPYNGLFAFGQTGKAGSYQMLGVSTGSYTVEFSPCFEQNLQTAYDNTRVVAPRTTTGVDATLLAGGSVSGVITTAGPAAVPVAEECAEVISANPNNVGGLGVSGVGGKYLATGIAPGSYTVYLGDPACGLGPPDLTPQWYDNQASQAHATTITVKVGQTTTGIDAALPTTGEITGTVAGPADAALTGVCVTAYPATAGSVPIVAVSRKGGYSLIDLQPGRYRVEFSSGCGATGYRAQWWRRARSARTARVITVAATQVVSGISATLAR